MKQALKSLVLMLFSAPLLVTPHPLDSEASPTAQVLLDEEAGLQVTEQVCSGCHGVDFFAGKRLTREMWRLTVEDMIGRGAVGTQEQFDQIVSYLAAYRGEAINVNAAEIWVLGQVLDIPRDQAQAIINFRAANGKFDSLEDLRKVPGLDLARLEEQKLNLKFE